MLYLCYCSICSLFLANTTTTSDNVIESAIETTANIESHTTEEEEEKEEKDQSTKAETEEEVESLTTCSTMTSNTVIESATYATHLILLPVKKKKKRLPVLLLQLLPSTDNRTITYIACIKVEEEDDESNTVIERFCSRSRIVLFATNATGASSTISIGNKRFRFCSRSRIVFISSLRSCSSFCYCYCAA